MNHTASHAPVFYDTDGVRVTPQAITGPGFTYVIRDVRAAKLQVVSFSGWRVHLKIAAVFVTGFLVALVIPWLGWTILTGAIATWWFTGFAYSLRVVISTSSGDMVLATHSIFPFRPRADQKHEEAAIKADKLLDAITQALTHESEPKVA